MDFMLGCNYWASHAGIEMWADWDEKVVEDDFKRLSEYGMEYLRVFPNWRDFQPVCAYYGIKNKFREYRHTNGSLFDNPYYLDKVMLDRFETMCSLAEKYNLKLIVGLITGWMSGRMFTPPVLEGVNLITSPVALELEIKFIKGFVSRFYTQKAIYAWDLGNECNCLSEVTSRQEAAVWTALVSNTIRATDKIGKPVISGMHGNRIENDWTIADQAEYTDVLTTHPYPLFVEHCAKDNMLSYRTLLHATAESAFVRDVGKKPCLVEELGTLGPCTCDDETAASFLKTNLYSNWANGMMGVMWWCANEQVELETPPYTWIMMERELGLFDKDKKPKPTLEEYKAFSEFLAQFGDKLNPPESDATCILTQGQDHWGIAYASYLLAKETGVNISFASFDAEIPDSNIYLLPSMVNNLSKEKLDDIMKRVSRGATLYMSNSLAYTAELEKLTGVHIKNSSGHKISSTFELRGERISYKTNKDFEIESESAIAINEEGVPVFTKYKYGVGTVYYLNFPLEEMILSLDDFDKGSYYKVYEEVFSEHINSRIATKTNKYVGLTLHKRDNGYYAVLVNYSDKPQKTGFTLIDSYKLEKIYKGDPEKLEPNGVAVISVKKV